MHEEVAVRRVVLSLDLRGRHAGIKRGNDDHRHSNFGEKIHRHPENRRGSYHTNREADEKNKERIP